MNTNKTTQFAFVGVAAVTLITAGFWMAKDKPVQKNVANSASDAASDAESEAAFKRVLQIREKAKYELPGPSQKTAPASVLAKTNKVPTLEELGVSPEDAAEARAQYVAYLKRVEELKRPQDSGPLPAAIVDTLPQEFQDRIARGEKATY
ncbi:MAG: hypothetical protein KDD51_10635 [Bdellovibrionales bacterium]|nr:hypothetical protein [Bdellovibrionales bacterium]